MNSDPVRVRLFQALEEVQGRVEIDHDATLNEDLSVYPILAHMEDLDKLEGDLGEPANGNGLVKMADADELYEALHIASDELGVYNSGPEKIAKVGHEYQHATAAQALGLRAIHAVRFMARDGLVGMKVTTIPVGEGVTKLGFASIIAHPLRLSRSDMRKLEAIGYGGPGDIAGRIMGTDTTLPFPMSVKI